MVSPKCDCLTQTTKGQIRLMSNCKPLGQIVGITFFVQLVQLILTPFTTFGSFGKSKNDQLCTCISNKQLQRGKNLENAECANMIELQLSELSCSSLSGISAIRSFNGEG